MINLNEIGVAAPSSSTVTRPGVTTVPSGGITTMPGVLLCLLTVAFPKPNYAVAWHAHNDRRPGISKGKRRRIPTNLREGILFFRTLPIFSRHPSASYPRVEPASLWPPPQTADGTCR